MDVDGVAVVVICAAAAAVWVVGALKKRRLHGLVCRGGV